MRQLSLFLAIACLSVLSCKKDVSPEEQLQIDIQKIKDYLVANNLTATETASGLHYIITQEGTGNNPTLQSNVTVKYKGYLLDGTVFDQTSGSQTITFPLGNLIEAWKEGILLMKRGGKGTFFSPSALAYGPDDIAGIPANSVLIFEIELVNFDVTPGEQLQIDIQKIKDYLAANNLTATETASGLHYIITQEGTGGNPTLQSNVTVRYKGYLLDGTVFDQTSGTSTVTFPLANLIQAWKEGIPLMKKGGKGTFFSPSALAYGPNGVPGIPGNSVLVFEIELVNF